MTDGEALWISKLVAREMKKSGWRVKSVEVTPRLHGGHLTIRVHSVPRMAAEPKAYVFNIEELEP